MTKILLITLLMIGCGSSETSKTKVIEWPALERADYLVRCTEGGGSKAFCECSLQRFENHFASEDEMFNSDIDTLASLLQGC